MPADANPTTPAEIQQAQALAALKAQKDLADAEKAAADARTAAFKANLGGVPESGIAGDVTLGDKAGTLEMTLLAHQALDTAAGQIARAVNSVLVKTDAGGQPVALPGARVFAFAAAQVPGFQTVSAFRVQRAAVTEALRRAIEAASVALGEAEASTESLAPAMVGVALDSVTKLLGFFRTDYKVAGAELTLDDVALLQAVAGKLQVPVFVPSIFNPAAVEGAGNLIKAELAELSAQLDPSRVLADKLETLIAQRQKTAADAATKASLRASLEREIAGLRTLTDRFKAASTAYDTLVGKLMAPDDATATMLRDLAVWNGLKQAGGKLLVLKVQRAGGSSYTEKNLWNFFGRMPFYVAGGVVVSYTLLNGTDGQVEAAGVVPVHGGFESVKGVRSRVNR
jgi:hypothetical protein